MIRSGSQLSNAPFVRLLFPLCLGVSTTFFSFSSPQLKILVLLPSFLAALYVLRNLTFYNQHYWGIILFLALFYFGIIRSVQEKIKFPQLQNQEYFAILDDFPIEKEKTYQAVAQFFENEHKILIYLPKSLQARAAKPGDIIEFIGSPELVSNDGNPFEFDYRSYLNDKKIGYRIFLKEKDFSLLPGFGKPTILHRALLLRARLIESLDQSGIRSDIVHLIASISFGAREEVDKEVIQSFTNTGVIHVLAVSGMNVGLIYVILNFLFRFLKFGRAGFFLHTIIMLSGIWIYTFVTGMSPSILRAAIMFSFVIIGETISRKADIFNSLAVSAFLLITWNPSIIRDVGFQLSYAAVLSIVIIQPILFKQVYFKSWLPAQIWLLISVTFAAQIGTLPFTLHYFHQFPVYFWLANLMVIPLITIILYLSFVVIFLATFSSFLASVSGIVLEWSVRLVLKIVTLVEALPHSVLGNLYPSLFQIFMVSIIGFLFCKYFQFKKPRYLKNALLATIFFSLSSGFTSYYRQTKAEIVFFNIPGTRVLSILNRGEAIVLYERLAKGNDRLGYYLKSYVGERGIHKVGLYELSDSLKIDRSDLCIRGNFVLFQNARIYIKPISSTGKMEVDPSFRIDVVWLPGPKANQTFNFHSQNVKYVLYNSAANLDFARSELDSSVCFKMNRAVLLTNQPNKLSCRYF